jgi:hypothetical protein
MSAIDFSAALSVIPETLRQPLLETFSTIVRNYRESRWEPSELNGGKFCEVVYSVLRGHIDGSFPRAPSKPRNMVEACKVLESDGASFPRAVRIQIPRMIIALYEIRNNRGVGHVGGDVDPNQMDARVVLEMAKWILADLVRIFHPKSISTEQATSIVDLLVERTVPAVWKVGDARRVLDPALKAREQVLLLLYSVTGAVTATDLFKWVEHSNLSVFKKQVLGQLHKARLIDFNSDTGLVTLSPTGTQEVELKLPLAVPI